KRIAMNVSEALKARRSVRAFSSAPVPLPLLREILDAARYAPSGGNMQPWRIIAVGGAARDAVVSLAQNAEHHDDGFPTYPANLWEPYRSRRYQLGEDMYALLQ